MQNCHRKAAHIWPAYCRPLVNCWRWGGGWKPDWDGKNSWVSVARKEPPTKEKVNILPLMTGTILWFQKKGQEREKRDPWDSAIVTNSMLHGTTTEASRISGSLKVLIFSYIIFPKGNCVCLFQDFFSKCILPQHPDPEVNIPQSRYVSPNSTPFPLQAL